MQWETARDLGGKMRGRFSLNLGAQCASPHAEAADAATVKMAVSRITCRSLQAVRLLFSSSSLTATDPWIG